MRPEARLLDYIDELAPPVSADEAIVRRQKPNRSLVRPSSTGPGWGPAWSVAAFAVVLAVAALSVVLSGNDGEVVDQTTVPTPTIAHSTITLTQESYERIEPGSYFVDADGDPTTTAGATFIIDRPGWIGSKEGVNFNHPQNGVSLHLRFFIEPFIPVCGLTGMTEGVPPLAGSTSGDLADEIAASGFTVREAPVPVNAFGHDGYHVVVEVPAGCQFGGEGTPHVWIYPGDVIEAWLFDIDGSIAMVEALWLAGSNAPDEYLELLRHVIDSVVLTP